MAVGTLIKPQVCIYISSNTLFVFYKQEKLTDLIKYGIVGLLVFIAGLMPFSNSISNLFRFILETLLFRLANTNMDLLMPFSFWGLFGFWKPDNITFGLD